MEDVYQPAPLGRAAAIGRRVGRMKWDRYPQGIFLFLARRKTEWTRGFNPTAAGFGERGAPNPDDAKNMVGEGLTTLLRRWDPNQWPAAFVPGHTSGGRRGRAAAASGGGRRALTAGDLELVWG